MKPETENRVREMIEERMSDHWDSHSSITHDLMSIDQRLKALEELNAPPTREPEPKLSDDIGLVDRCAEAFEAVLAAYGTYSPKLIRRAVIHAAIEEVASELSLRLEHTAASFLRDELSKKP